MRWRRWQDGRRSCSLLCSCTRLCSCNLPCALDCCDGQKKEGLHEGSRFLFALTRADRGLQASLPPMRLTSGPLSGVPGSMGCHIQTPLGASGVSTLPLNQPLRCAMLITSCEYGVPRHSTSGQSSQWQHRACLLHRGHSATQQPSMWSSPGAASQSRQRRMGKASTLHALHAHGPTKGRASKLFPLKSLNMLSSIGFYFGSHIYLLDLNALEIDAQKERPRFPRGPRFTAATARSARGGRGCMPKDGQTL